MVVKRGIHCLDREAYNFLLFHTGHAQSRRFGFAPCRDRCKIIAMAFFNHARHLLTLAGLVADAQSIVVSNDDQV